MKHTVNILSVAAVLILGVSGVVNAYVYDGFDTGFGSFPNSGNGWGGSSGITVTNGNRAVGAGALTIPVTMTLSNSTSSGQAIVWTDFYTIPRLFRSDTDPIPPIDPDATAQFFVNSNGMWTVISGDGNGGSNVTTLTTVLGPSGGVYPTVTENNVYYHISVLNNYVSSNWSFFVNNMPLATNLTPLASTTHHEWFQVQNLGGPVSNLCWLDEFLVTNRIPAVIGNTNYLPGTTIPQAAAFAYFGSFEDPSPTPSSGSFMNGTLSGVSLQLGDMVLDGRQYALIGSSSLNGTVFTNAGFADAGGLIEISGLLSNQTRYFGRIVTISAGGEIAVTNNVIIACYKQTRQPNRYYFTGVPVAPMGGDDSLDGPLGRQLAKGLRGGALLTVAVGGTLMTYRRDDSFYSWSQVDSIIPPDQVHLTPGMGVRIMTTNSPANSDTNTIFVGLQQTSPVSITLSPGWNILAWPYDASGTLGPSIANAYGNNNPAAYALGDFALVQQSGSINPVQSRYVISPTAGSHWRQFFNTTGGTILDTMPLQSGDGLMYNMYAPGGVRPGAAAVWQPSPGH